MNVFFTLLKFHFRTPVHFATAQNEYGLSEKTLHSDALYAALAQAAADLKVPHQDVFHVESGLPEGFALSSLFPFSSDRLFFPIPKHSLTHTAGALARKQLTKLKFVDQDIFKDLLESGVYDLQATEARGIYCTRAGRNFSEHFMQSAVFPRIRAPRSGVTSETEPFYIERIFFQKNSGLFCLARFDDETGFRLIKALLNYLGDEGLGTDRHVGHGQYDLEVEHLGQKPSFFPEKTSNYSTNLSLFCPEDATSLAEQIDINCQYDLLKRGGWMTAPGYLTYRKNSVYMFREGSIFKLSEQVAGKTVNLKPTGTPKKVDHNILRCGTSIFVPIQIPAKK
jgi:CRISPR type III-A-associated RAMP protein Csm4